MPGPLALVGSGEYLEIMRPLDAELLAGRPARAVLIPTAAAEEGEERVAYWLELGIAHFAALGAETVPLRVLERADAERADLAAQVAGAGLIYLSGGNPGYLADTLRDSALWHAILAAWRGGAALAGCSAGACALSAVADDIRRPGRFSGRGLGIVPELAVIPHFDRFSAFAPGVVDAILAASADGVEVIGIDEETALVGGPQRWTVAGRQSVWRIERDGTRRRVATGDGFDIGSPAAEPVAG